ncbi:MAG: Ni/Fe hydrogenase, partial [Campylobacterota bacterium]|nr:Ni/Fe hydrogenase [Campylobacterota bacterium]
SSSDDRKAGSIEIISDEELIENSGLKKTANEVEITEMLQICSMAEKVAKTVIVSIVPEDIISVEVGLTPVMREKWMLYIESVISELEKCGVSTKEKEATIALEHIIETFANPSLQEGRVF